MSAESASDRLKRATTAVVKTLSADPEAKVVLTAGTAETAGSTVRLPVPSRDMTPEEVTTIRAGGDFAALWMRHHDPAAYHRLRPTEETARAAFEALEQERVAALSGPLAGVGRNLDWLLGDRVRRRGFDRAVRADQVPLAEALRLLAREIVGGRPLDSAGETALALWRPQLAPVEAALRDLAPLVGDQKGYGRAATRLLARLDLPVDLEAAEEEPEDEDQANEEQTDNQQRGGGAEDEPAEEKPNPPQGEAPKGDEDGEAPLQAEDGDQETEAVEGDDPAGPSAQRPQGRPGSGLPAYQVFTTRFDEVVTAEDLADPDELIRLREMLDDKLDHLRGVIGRLANRLQRQLLARQQRHWEFDLEEGVLDSGRLARVIANPLLPLSFKREKDIEFRDTVVGLLIDNSGSMRGRPIEIAALSADILARTLERCGVKTEILGFTTRAWKGGRAREAWVQAGKPASPGRLNDLRHIVYKPADMPHRRAKMNLGLMLKEGMLKENIDGEALMWAHQRLIGRPEERKILMVVSDGAPLDDSTLSVNHAQYLEAHLHAVIGWIETQSPVELAAIGIGHDVTRYYKRAVMILDAEQLGGTMMNQLVGLFGDG